jgi:hypothetical protein
MAREVDIPWFDRHQDPRPAPVKSEELPSLEEKLRRWIPYVGLVAVLLAAWVLSGPKTKAPPRVRPAESRGSLLGLMPVVAIPKGSLLDAELLRPVRLPPSSLTRLQAMRLLTPEDLPKIGSGLRAGKDLPPERPVFWTDLRLLRENPAAGRIRIHYGTAP